MSLTQFAMVEELAFLIKDNLTSKHLVLSVEDDLVNILEDDASPDGALELQPMDPYHRLLVHRLAEIFGFAHESIGEGGDRHLVLKRCLETSIPSVLVSDILYQQDIFQTPPTPNEILKRDDASSVLKMRTVPRSITIEEREEAYLAARCRIFSMDDNDLAETIMQRPRHIPAAAQRMIAHALGQRINPSRQGRGIDRGKGSAKSDPPEIKAKDHDYSISHKEERHKCDKLCGHDCKKTSKPKFSGVCTNGNGSPSAENMRRENIGAAKKMFAHALGIQSSKKVVLPDSEK